MKALVYGTGTLLFIGAVSYIGNNGTVFMMLTVIVGSLSVVFSGLFSGAFFTSVRGSRDIFSDNEDFRRRHRWATNVFLFGLPSIVGAVIAYFLL